MSFLSPMLRHPRSSYRLVNATRALVLADVIQPAFDSQERRRGLLGRDSLSDETALVIAPSSAIHTFGMNFPIDALFVSGRGEILKCVTGLKRRRIAVRPGAFAVIEFCANHKAVACCRRGDVLAVEAQESVGRRVTQ